MSAAASGRRTGSGPSSRRGAPPPVGGTPDWVPQHHRDITLGRVEGYLAANQFADRNLRAGLWAARSPEAVSLEVYSHPKDLPYPTYEEAIRMPYRPAKVGDVFGPSWTTHWFRVRARVPPEWGQLGPLMFRWDSGSEAMLYSDGPTPRQGITDQRNEYLLAERAAGGQEMVLYVEMAANGMFGNGTDIQPPDENRYFTLKAAELAIPNVPVTALYHDLRALLGLAKELPPGNATGEAALYTANQIINTYAADDPSSVEECRQLAASVLAARDMGERLQVYAVGHCHIDTAWLWPFSETHRKTARSWSSQLRLAERYPWHVFTASSAQQYEWLLQDYPGLFAEIQDAAARGSFVPVGGTWVEMDTNLPSGESLVRQFMYGQRFFESYFRSRCDVFWLPDTFGYSAQLPQIANGAGIQYFMTQKLSWNNINSFPHSTFYWAGLDGSRLLTHFPPANTYNAQADAHDILMTATGSKDKDRAPAAYMLYGNGDGGGGPTVDMCESLSRLAGCRGLASLTLAGPGDFFRRLEDVSRDLLTWRGELYFELHRGTYTSHAANKSDNRTCELLLREVEAAGALAALVLSPEAYCYPRSEVDAIWKDVLLFQFHDVLPGSAIGIVYEHTAKRYPKIKSSLRKIRDAALSAVLEATANHAPSSNAATATSAGWAFAAASTISPSIPVAAATAAATGPHVATGTPPHGSNPVPQPPNRHDDFMSRPLAPLEVAGARTVPELAPSWHPGSKESQAEAAVTTVAAGMAVPSGTGMGAGPPAAGALDCSRRSEGDAVAWVFNSLAFARREVVSLPVELLAPGTSVRQLSADRKSALVVVQAPPLSLTPVTPPELSTGWGVAGPKAAAAMAGKGAVAEAAMAAQAAVLGGERVQEGPPDGVVLQVLRRGAARPAGDVVSAAAAAADGGVEPAAAGGGCSDDVVVYVMQNSLVRAIFDDSGRLTSLYDIVWRRELVAQGSAGNVFRLYEDVPLFWDAWDIEIYHLEKGQEAGLGMPRPKVSILETGPLRCQLLLEAALSPGAFLRQTISMTAVSARIDFHCEVEWRENRRCLKVEFPWRLDSPAATYEVQFGAVERPTHTNTSWDWARFEVCAHKWADLSEPGYGVTLLNDCKYGHATFGNVMRLTLLRSPKAPDANTDMANHVFRYGLLPHAMGWAPAGVAAHGWAFNAPLRLLPPPLPPSTMTTVTALPLASVPLSPQLAASSAAVRGPAAMRARAVGRFDPSQPMFVVANARPNPLTASAAVAGNGIIPPPLILDTIKLPEPPSLSNPVAQRPQPHHLHQPAVPNSSGPQTASSLPATAPHPPPSPTPTSTCATPHGCSAMASVPAAAAAGGDDASSGAGAEDPIAVVLRLYEPHGARGMARVTWPSWLRVTHVARCNLLEEDLEGASEGAERGLVVRVDDAGGTVDVPYRPYKIITLKLYLEQ